MYSSPVSHVAPSLDFHCYGLWGNDDLNVTAYSYSPLPNCPMLPQSSLRLECARLPGQHAAFTAQVHLIAPFVNPIKLFLWQEVNALCHFGGSYGYRSRATRLTTWRSAIKLMSQTFYSTSKTPRRRRVLNIYPPAVPMINSTTRLSKSATAIKIKAATNKRYRPVLTMRFFLLSLQRRCEQFFQRGFFELSV